MSEVKGAEGPPKPTGDAARAAQPRIGYDGQATQNLVVSVRGFRLMVGLMLVNTVLIASTVLGPQLFPFMRGQWQQWQARRAAAAQAKSDLATLRQGLAHKMPEGRVVYEEDPEAAAKLLAGGAGAYQAAVNFPQHRPNNWMPPVMAAPPTYYTQFVRVAFNQQIGGPEYPLLFLHERVTPAGQKHLVTVSLLADFQFDQPRTRPREAGIGGPYGGYGGYGDREAPRGLKIQPGETVFVMKKRRLLSVVTYLVDGPRTPDGGYRGRGSAMTRSVNLELPDSKSWVVGRVMENTGGDAGGSGEPKLDYGHRLRFFAGQPDPTDSSHFTIPYQLDGRDGSIDGWVKDGGIDIRPREGQLSYGSDGEAWKLPAAAATQAETQKTSPPGGDGEPPGEE